MPAAMLAGLAAAGDDADLVLAEGAMGLFDGVAHPGSAGTGASADIAALMGWPVVLVIDVSGQAQSAGAVARGLAGFRSGVTVAGVVLNRVASPRHEALVRAGMAEAGIAVFGALPKDPTITVPERHLGLVQAEEQPALQALIATVASLVAERIDLDALLACAASAGKAARTPRFRPPGQRIALARDAAFSFVYSHLLDGWRAAGAEILPFSPLADEPPDSAADVCWLPGGYPELHAGRLAAADRFRAGLADFAATRAVHGECGGYMAMGEGLIDRDGTRHRMAGILGLVTSFADRRMHLGYRRAALLAPTPGFASGCLAGHEFHYSTVVAQPDPPLAQVTDANGAAVPETGSTRTFTGGGRASGTFFHVIAEAP
jgi:cobyrinic acid a,c-diamide synthase